MMAVLKSASEIWKKDFYYILHFLPLCTKMTLARPILELDPKYFLQMKIERKFKLSQPNNNHND